MADWASRYQTLRDRLQSLPSVIASGSESEPDIRAHALLDIGEVCDRISPTLVPRLVGEGTTNEQLEEMLAEIGENLREILYHVRDPLYFRYLLADTDAGELSGE